MRIGSTTSCRRNCPYIAGAIAFYTLFSLFPLFLAIISILGYVLGPETDSTELAVQIAEVIPISTESIGETVEGVVRARAITGIASILGLLWAASAVFGAIRKGINYAWGIRKTRRFLQERLMDVTLVLGAGMLVLARPVHGNRLWRFQRGHRRARSGVDLRQRIPVGDRSQARLRRAGLPHVPAALSLPAKHDRAVQRRLAGSACGRLSPSAARTGSSSGTCRRSRSITSCTGPSGAVLALLTWVYLSAIILLFGALVTSRYAAQASRRDNEEQGLKMIWAGLSRVRLRVVESPAVA